MNKNKSNGMAEFEALLNQQFSTFRKGFNPGEDVRATVLSVNSEFVVLDVNAKNEGLAPRVDFLNEDGEVSVKVGDTVDVVFVSAEGGAYRFAAKGAKVSVDHSVADAYEAGLPIDGRVQAEINGGYEVTVGSMRAFCPYSQIALFRQEGAVYVGQTFSFLIQEYDAEGGNLVVSRRALLEQERNRKRDELRESLVAGATCKGRVSRIVDFGFFVDLGGAEGLVPMKELSWQRNVKPEDVVKVGETVEVLVREIDWERNRISLSLRATQADPFDAFAANCAPGAEFHGRVTRLAQFGAFVELEPGVEGLITTGALARGRSIARPSQVVSEGQELDVKVDSIDFDRHRISLRLVPTPAEVEAAERARAKREERLNKPATDEEQAAKEAVDVRKALEDFHKAKSDNGTFGSLGDAFANIKL